MNKRVLTVLLLALLIFVTGCSKASVEQQESILKIAYTTDPQGLDPHRTAAVSTLMLLEIFMIHSWR